jgi:hypothetical protein
MSKEKLLLGLIIVVALITAGCTGTKTMVGNGQTPVSAGQTAAMNAYNRSVSLLNDEIDYLLNDYKPSASMTVDQYGTWLSGFSDKLALCHELYNNTSAAATKYLAYLNSSSPEYANITAADTNYGNQINSLNGTYGEYADYLNTSIQENDALQAYETKLNASFDAYNDLTSFAKSANISSMGAYANFVTVFGQKQSAFASSANSAIAAGNAYKQYLAPNSSESSAVDSNANALTSEVQATSAAYSKYKSDYESKTQAQADASSDFTNYVNLMKTVLSDKSALDSYNTTATALQRLNSNWIAGYKQRIDTFDTDANAAISAGDTCKQYLAPSSSDYQTIATNENNMKSAIAAYNQDYNELNTAYNDLHPLGNI